VKTFVGNSFRVLFAFLFALSLPPLAHSQHGGGGGHGGGHMGGGHFGGRGHLGGSGHVRGTSGRDAGSARAHGIRRIPPFSAVRLFDHRHHRRHFREPFVANGLFIGGFVDCGFWDWDCGWGWNSGWDDSYFDIDNWTRPATPPQTLSGSGSANTSRPVAVLYFKNGYSVGVTQYWLENGAVHYVTTYGGENVIPFSDLDLQRTVDENAGNDPPFVLRPKQPQSPPENR